MNSIIETLYSVFGSYPLEEETQAVQASKEAVRAAGQHLTYDEFENLWNAIGDIKDASDLGSFTLGFRLGVQLMLEGLRPIAPED